MFDTWCLVATASSPSAWPGASLSVSLCGLRPRSSLPTCWKASLGGLNSSSRPLLPFACSTPRCGVGRGSFLGWPPGSPIASVFLELGWPDAEHLAFSRLLSLFGRVHAMPSGDPCPLPALIFNFASAVPGSCRRSVLTFADLLVLPFQEVLVSALVPPLTVSTPGFVHASLLAYTQSLRQRLCTAASTLTISHVDLRLLSVNQGPDHVVHGRSTCSSVGARSMGSPSLPLVVVQLVTLATHFLACSVMLLKGIWPTACLRVLLSRTSVSNGVVGSLFIWMLLLSGLATLGCSTQAPLTTLLPLLSRTSHLSGKCVNDFCHCLSAFPCQGLPSILLWFTFPLWSFSEAFVCESFDPCVESLTGCLSLASPASGYGS